MFPKINDHVYIQIASEIEKENKQEYKSRIAEMEDDSILMEVPIPVEGGKMKKLYMGDELSMYFVNDEGVKHYFNTYVLGYKSDNIQLVRIRRPELDSITKVQRRNFLRVIAELEVAVRTEKNVRFIALTEDVGGGGISFYVDPTYKLNEEELLHCWVLLPYKNGTIEHVPIETEIVRMKKLETGRNLVMLKFRNIADIERQKLIRYCFERQFDFRNR
ncbi:c-di-GMP-binding flagellar brake protein YcgR [Paenibacillus shirakamiensis]|uniref:C-di-GMP-binding flagellar brake protein YcgR n=1 Tax=Paenibacillus shirakamiensis TaxID=1265935 RepID=A0ABS4JCR8_9BACL|nr:flagellar brake domain-containing protein [Paenibacillus shirakamiensis]MBP1999517.1 c-di-GMP-binding flagellar brake protein YcgR [Paenibacillus shirakamiensis]